MTRSLIVSINGVTQAPADFVAKGNRVVFIHAPGNGDLVDFKCVTKNDVNTSSYLGTGTQTTFNLPSWPRDKFEVVTDCETIAPNGYTVVDVHYEIESWIRENCPVSDWKWDDQLRDPRVAGHFGMIRLIIKDSVLTFIATKWA